MIDSSWNDLFQLNLHPNLDELYSSKQSIFPDKSNVFKTFQIKVQDIKFVFLGQDPYFSHHLADGLAFSVSKSSIIPPSLKNIFKEIKNEFPDRNYEFKHGDLSKWLLQNKILLLNSSLTVLENKPNSMKKHWNLFINETLKFIEKNNPNSLFIFLGKQSLSKLKFLSNHNNIIFRNHPSPQSAHLGFFNSNLFKEIEQKIGHEINWSNDD
jgi:uracil-DNA glycosylase